MINLTQNKIAQLIQVYRDDLQRFLTRRLNCADTAADIIQEVFLRLTQHGFNQHLSNPRAFLFQVAANLATDHQRRCRSQSNHLSEEAIPTEIPDPSPPIETVLFNKYQVMVLKQAIAELPPKCREVFILHKFEHLSYAEVAIRLGISKSTVVKHMVKALEYCKRRVDASSH